MLRSPGAAASVTATDASFLLEDDADPTKILAFQLSGLTTGTTRTLIPPDANGTLALISGLSYRNILRANGGFEVWQRGAGASASIAVAASTTAYVADRWYLKTAANEASVVSAQAGLTSASRLCARVQRNSGQTGTGAVYFAYPLDTDEVVALRGATPILSFYVASGANWSPTSGTLSVKLYCGTGAVAKRNSSALTGETNPLASSTNLTASQAATLVTMTAGSSVATNVTQAELQFTWTPVGTAGANDWFSIDDLQLETSAAVTPFERRQFAEERELCMEHYRSSFPYGTAPAQSAAVAGALTVKNPIALGDPAIWVGFDPPMRTTPTLTTYNPSAANANWRDVTAGADATVSVDPATSIGPTGVLIATSGTVTALGDVLCIHYAADAGI